MCVSLSFSPCRSCDYSPPRLAILVLHHAEGVDAAVLLELPAELLLGGVVADLGDEEGLVSVALGLRIVLRVPLGDLVLEAFLIGLCPFNTWAGLLGVSTYGCGSDFATLMLWWWSWLLLCSRQNPSRLAPSGASIAPG